MTQSKYREVVQYLERQRKARNLKVEELACEGLSPSTIRRIFSLKYFLKEEKLRLLCRQFGYQLEEITQILGYENLHQLNQNLEDIETDIETKVDLKQSISELDEISQNLDDDHLYAQVIHYLKAKAYFYQGPHCFDQAEKEALCAIGASEKHESSDMNIAGCAHNILSNIYYKTKGLKSAYLEVSKAIDKFNLNGKRVDIYFLSLMNKASYLEKMDRIREAEDILTYLVENISRITKAWRQANIYEQQARVKMENRQYEEALKYCRLGERIAIDNGLDDRIFELRIVRGNIHEKKEELDEAINMYKRALKLQSKLPSESPLLLTGYAHIGDVYRRQRNFEQAKKYLVKALDIKDDSVRYVHALEAFARLCIDQDQLGQAVDPLKEALKLSAAQGLKKKEQEICLLLAQCYEFTDQTQFLKYQHLYYRLGLEAQK
jgi:tetratricopeptide (TPR) repeat protein